MTTLIMAVKETIGRLNQRFKNQDTSIFSNSSPYGFINLVKPTIGGTMS